MMQNNILMLKYEMPFEWAALLRFFALRTILGVEETTSSLYRRTIRLNDTIGVLQVSNIQISNAEGLLQVEFWLPFNALTQDTIVRLRTMFDLDANLPEIALHLSRDPVMAELVRKRPHLRIPGGWDTFEVAIRAVLGQQVSIAAAVVLAVRLVARCGEDLPESPFPSLNRLFPTPHALIAADLSGMGMPGARVTALKAVAEAFIEDPFLFRKGSSTEETVARLRRIKGIGDWTAQYIAIRACREFDAFPAGDAGILRGLTDASGRPKESDIRARAESWSPYRAYAAHHIWVNDEMKE